MSAKKDEPVSRCTWILGPCVDGTMAGKRCSRSGPGGRCPRHQFGTRGKRQARAREAGDARSVANAAPSQGIGRQMSGEHNHPENEREIDRLDSELDAIYDELDKRLVRIEQQLGVEVPEKES